MSYIGFPVAFQHSPLKC